LITYTLKLKRLTVFGTAGKLGTSGRGLIKVETCDVIATGDVVGVVFNDEVDKSVGE
jgi:hypothetical protein